MTLFASKGAAGVVVLRVEIADESLAVLAFPIVWGALTQLSLHFGLGEQLDNACA